MPSDRFSGRLALSARIRDALLTRIVEGALMPGERLVEMRLAEEFGTSQSPVREALRELEMSGMVESSRNRGTRVKVTTLAELREIYDVRAELEAYAGGIAAPRLLAEGLQPLRDSIDTMLEHAKRMDLVGFSEANARFHLLIIEATNNATLLDVWKRLDVKSRTTINIIRSAANLEATARSHLRIVAALESGNTSLVKRELRAHVLKFKPHALIGAETGNDQAAQDEAQ